MIDSPSPPLSDGSSSSGSQRIVVLGTCGSGKTTLARELSRRLNCSHVELDALHWEPGWTPADKEVFRARVSAAIAGDWWVLDGGYGTVRDLVWSRADLLVWLDYSPPIKFYRLFCRTMRRLILRECLWNDNRETWRDQFLSRESIFLWFFSQHGEHRRSFPALFEQPEYGHLPVLRFRSPRETRNWLNTFTAAAHHSDTSA